jgi:hypothetical protein
VTKAQRAENVPDLASVFRQGELERAQGGPGAGRGTASPVRGAKEGYVRTRTTGRDLYL